MAATPRRIIEVCSGTGALGVGIGRAFPGARTICHVEREAYPAVVLASRMEEGALDPAPIWLGDLAELPADGWVGLADTVAASIPCQGNSVAGKRLGVDDERWLWPDVERLLRVVRPRFFILENPTGLLTVSEHVAHRAATGGGGGVMDDQLYMVFDVESIGLHGEGFAVGYVVTGPGMQCMAGTRYACHPDRANGGPEGRAWVAENCPPVEFDCASPRVVRNRFWRDWLLMKERGAVLVAHCAWPVEARFLAACVDDDPDTRAWEGPYPLHELASFMVAAGLDPTATYDRLPDEMQHDPLGDAKQSARLLMEALGILEAKRAAR